MCHRDGYVDNLNQNSHSSGMSTTPTTDTGRQAVTLSVPLWICSWCQIKADVAGCHVCQCQYSSLSTSHFLRHRLSL